MIRIKEKFYCGHNYNVPKGYKRRGSRSECLKIGIGAGKHSKHKIDDDFFNDYIIFRDKLTNFKGWNCYNNNYEIDVRGNVVKFCMPKTDNINLISNRDFFKNITKTVPMVCPHKACNCDGLLKQLKIKNE